MSQKTSYSLRRPGSQSSAVGGLVGFVSPLAGSFLPSRLHTSHIPVSVVIIIVSVVRGAWGSASGVPSALVGHNHLPRTVPLGGRTAETRSVSLCSAQMEKDKVKWKHPQTGGSWEKWQKLLLQAYPHSKASSFIGLSVARKDFFLPYQ